MLQSVPERTMLQSVPVKVQAMAAGSHVITYNAVISASEICQQGQQALRLLADTRSIHLEPNVFTYNAAISAYEKCEQWQLALGLQAEMRNVIFANKCYPLQCCNQCLKEVQAMAAGTQPAGRHTKR